MSLAKIISGGQTGVDRGALDAALERGFPCGGWCSAGRKAEDGLIPDSYPLQELDSDSSRERTVHNIVGSDATVILYFDRLREGTGQIALHCVANHKPHRLIDAAGLERSDAAVAIREFVQAHEVGVLHVTGPRLSKEPRAHEYSYETLLAVIDAFS